VNHRLRFRLLACLSALGAITACVVDPLNPQPLPPGPPENGATFGMDAAAVPLAPDGGAKNASDSGALRDDDAAPPPSADGGPTDAGDAGDSGDAGDAG
jgi:hypothetical protein